MVNSVFATFIAENEIELEKPQPIDRPLKNLELLLGWLNRWPKDRITLREIQAFGPGPVRDRKVALNLMQTLTERGWVLPTKPRRYDMTRWEIARVARPHPPPTIQPRP